MNKLRRILLTVILLCATRVAVAPEPREPQVVFVKKARASYYGVGFNGKLTAGGTKFNANAMTAAHKKFPFGTVLKVVNPRTKQWVFVTVTDRGPFVKSRELDLSYAAARRIGILSAGVVTVAIYRRLP
jgi:rare lipoprotein A